MSGVSGRRLATEIVPIAALGDADTRTLFALFARHYEHVDRARFAADLAEKDCVIVLRERGAGVIRGFSTQQVLSFSVDGEPLRALFSGDTIIEPAFWGDQELVRGWCRFAGTVRASSPGVRLFWFLISKGYRTYLYLPLFFRRYLPAPGVSPTPFEQAAIDTLAEMKFAPYYRRDSGLLEFPDRRGNLTPALAAVPEGRRADPRVRFFLERNPTYAIGTELVCLAEISPGNMRSIAGRALDEAQAAPAVRGAAEGEPMSATLGAAAAR
jgi:hypothetical protein